MVYCLQSLYFTCRSSQIKFHVCPSSDGLMSSSPPAGRDAGAFGLTRPEPLRLRCEHDYEPASVLDRYRPCLLADMVNQPEVELQGTRAG